MNSDRRSERRVALATVLVVDDLVSSRTLLRKALEEEGCAVVEATDGGHALEAVRHERPNVVVVSSALGAAPDAALDVLSALRRDRGTAEIPILIRPPTVDAALTTREVLQEAVNAAVRADTDQREVAGEREVAAFAAGGAPDERVSAVAVGIDDIHRLKYEHGELVGLAVLKIAARRIASVADAGAIVVRTSEAGFAVLVPGLDAAATEALGSRVRAVIAGAPFSLATGRSLHVTASVGSVVTTREGIERGVADAAEAMERAAAEGRSRSRPD